MLVPVTAARTVRATCGCAERDTHWLCLESDLPGDALLLQLSRDRVRSEGLASWAWGTSPILVLVLGLALVPCWKSPVGHLQQALLELGLRVQSRTVWATMCSGRGGSG